LTRFFLIFFIFLFICFPLFSQETASETDTEINHENEQALSDYGDDSIFIINSFKYNVKGITLVYMLNMKTELKTGEEIKGSENLAKFIQDKRQLLINQRVLTDVVVIEHTVNPVNEDGKYPVDLVIYVEDTWNLFALPYPRYNTNDGFSLTIKARDYNFLGTMNPLRIDLGYKYDEKGQSFFNLMIDSGIPFSFFGLDWYFDFDNYIDYRPDLSQPFYYRNKTGISVDIPIKRSTLNIWFSESIIVHDANSSVDISDYNLGDVQFGPFMQSNPRISWTIPTGLMVGEYGELEYSPSLYAFFNHEFKDFPLSENRKGEHYYFSHNLKFGRIDWIGNFRKGISFNASNTFSFNTYFYSKNDERNWNPWGYNYSLNLIGHFILIDDKLGLSTRLFHRHWIKSKNEEAGDVIRGVTNKSINAEAILSLNLDLIFRPLRFLPSKWFPESKFWRIFDFDLHTNPVIDIAWYKPYQGEASFKSGNFAFGAGIEFIIFPHRFRSLYFRISPAWGFSKLSDTSFHIRRNFELDAEMGFHY